MKQRIVCFCEHSFETDIPAMVDLGREPEVEEQIVRGEFLNVRCPACGKILKPEFPVFIKDPQAENSIFFVPELDRSAFYRGNLPYSLQEANRVAIGYEELAEKFLIKRNGLDDRVLEIVKYYLLGKILEDFEGEKEVRILFSKREADNVFFTVHGWKEEEVGVLKVTRETLDKAAAQLEEKRIQEPFSEILNAPYISINKLYAEGLD